MARERRQLKVGRLIPLVPAAVFLAGCGSDRTQTSLRPASHASRDIASLFWWMMGIAWGGLAIVVLLLVMAWVRRNRTGVPGDSEGPKAGERMGWYVVVGGGIVLPIALISALFGVADLLVIRTTQAPAAGATRMTVTAIGHQWWWEFRYPGTTVVTAGELHIPVRTPIRVDVRTTDVIHSFWAPELNRTIDAIPGRTNAIQFYADRAGDYRGQCDEFCGLQHAHMAFWVIAQPEAAFRRWLARQARPAVQPPRGSAAQKGEQEFMAGACASCHTIRGTAASGDVGPDLTHLASRSTLASATIPNDRAYLSGWIVDSQRIKPGNDMPDISLTTAQLDDLVAYLEGLQ